jgi:hypothetical protein
MSLKNGSFGRHSVNLYSADNQAGGGFLSQNSAGRGSQEHFIASPTNFTVDDSHKANKFKRNIMASQRLEPMKDLIGDTTSQEAKFIPDNFSREITLKKTNTVTAPSTGTGTTPNSYYTSASRVKKFVTNRAYMNCGI